MQCTCVESPVLIALSIGRRGGAGCLRGGGAVVNAHRGVAIAVVRADVESFGIERAWESEDSYSTRVSKGRTGNN